MGQASASSSSSSGIQTSGNITNNANSWVVWAVIGVIALLYFTMKGKH
jgi:hypothetical protein